MNVAPGLIFGWELIGRVISVRFSKARNSARACYSDMGGLAFFVNQLGRGWFEQGVTEDVDHLILHELAHEYASNHLSDEYHDAICKIAIRLKNLALEKPQLFKKEIK